MSYLIFCTLLLAPAYALRFSIGPAPLNLLMAWVVLLWLCFGYYLARQQKLAGFWFWLKSLNKWWLGLVSLFFLAGVISLFVPKFSQKNLGQFIVLIFQPISLFFLFGYLFYKNPGTKNAWTYAAYLLLGIMGVWSIVQYFTLFGLPPQYWGNAVEPKRALGFFGHPNFYALFSAPLLAFLVPDLMERVRSYKHLPLTQKLFMFWLLGAVGLFLSMSRAGWLGLAVGLGLYVLIAGDKKLRYAALLAGVMLAGIVLITPNLRYRVLLPFLGEKSAVSRLSLWNTGLKGVKQSPVFGLGLTGFATEWPQLNTDPNLDTHNFPHNIFLDFWVETGLLGMLSFVGLSVLALYQGIKNRRSAFGLGVALFIITLLVQGQIDNPYFKNDLALIFWVTLSLII
ncbi:MAG: O-antigen ligase family protein [Patescibacteria group bacterium]|nr:O-antigen ligase family protein [Patescibacteria group bacterium]